MGPHTPQERIIRKTRPLQAPGLIASIMLLPVLFVGTAIAFTHEESDVEADQQRDFQVSGIKARDAKPAAAPDACERR